MKPLKVGAFIHGKKQQNGPPTTQTQTPPDHSNAPSPRVRKAELARIKVPPTNIKPAQYPTSRNAQYSTHYDDETLTPSQFAAATQDERGRDMFDTDLEGVDDSTTTFSLTRDPEPEHEQEPEPEPEPEYEHQHDNEPWVERPLSPREREVNRRTGLTYNEPRHEGPSGGNYRPIAERIRELESDDEVGHENAGYQQEEYEGTVTGENQHTEHQEHEMYPGEDNVDAKKPETMSWQKIEAILRADSSRRESEMEDQPTRRVDSPFPDTESQTEPENYAARQDEFISEEAMRNDYFDIPPTTPRPHPGKHSKGRFTGGSRFATPASRAKRNGRANSTEYAGVQPTPGPFPTPGMLDRSPSRPTTSYIPEPNHTDLTNGDYHHNDHTATTPGGLFDSITDISLFETTDSFEENTATHQQITTSFPSPQLSTLSPTSSKRPFSNFTSDYPPNILKTKSFSDLEAESFDYNPTPIQPIFPPQDPPLPLEDKLSRLNTLTEEQRRTFFSSLTIDEWEDSGDWLIGQFGSILQRTKEARRMRRKVATVFEAELKRRNDLLEGEGVEIKKRLEDMRTGGMGVLKGPKQ